MAKRKGTRPESKPEEKKSDRMGLNELHEAHNRLCSKEVPECRKTFMENEFRGHVLTLLAQKESKALSAPRHEEPEPEPVSASA